MDASKWPTEIVPGHDGIKQIIFIFSLSLGDPRTHLAPCSSLGPWQEPCSYFYHCWLLFQSCNPTLPILGDFLEFGSEGMMNGGFKFADPWDDSDVGPNGSVYTTDRGLWMAYREPRAVIEQYLKKNEWRSPMPGR